jgi:hypothetical protein
MTIKHRIAMALLGLIALGACGHADEAPEAATTPAEAPAPSTEAPSTTEKPFTCPAGERAVADPNTGMVCVAPTTTQAPTTTAAPTTTVSPQVKADADTVLGVAVIDTSRDEFIKILDEALVDDGSVDLWEAPTVVGGIPPVLSPLRVGITSGWATDEHQQEEAWNLVRLMSTFWQADGALRNDEGLLHAGFTMIVDGRTYDQTYETMVALADSRMLRSDWAGSVGL